MSYTVQTFDEILDGMLEDWRNRVPGVNTDAATEVYLRSAVVAGALWGAQCGLKYVENQIFPSTADLDTLRRHATTWGITPSAPAAADDGSITLTGTSGTVVASGLVLSHADGTTYTTTSGGTIASGVLVVTAECNVAGVVGNKGVGTALEHQAPPLGVDLEAEVTTAFTSGQDAESKAHLLARVLNRIRRGNAGGTANDYEQWALTVEGVSFAYALPLRRGAGTVDVAVFGADGDGNRIPSSSGVRGDVGAYIDTVRPVTASVQVPEIDLVSVDVEVTLTLLDEGLEVADVEAAVVAAIEALIYSVRPGASLYLTQLMRTVAAVEGVIDFDIVTPTGNVPSAATPDVCEALEPGTITVA